MEFWIINGIIHDAVKREPYQADILIKDGKIAEIGKYTSGEKFDARGKDIYPGLVEAHCHLGLWGSIRYDGEDYNERNNCLTPELNAIDAINLLESGLDRLCDRTIAITAPVELRVRRIMARDNIPEEYARLRIFAQKPDEYYRSKCSCELNNGGEQPEMFQAEAYTFFERLVETIREEQRSVVM